MSFGSPGASLCRPCQEGWVRMGVSKKERKLESQISFLKPRDASTEGLWAAWLCPIL